MSVMHFGTQGRHGDGLDEAEKLQLTIFLCMLLGLHIFLGCLSGLAFDMASENALYIFALTFVKYHFFDFLLFKQEDVVVRMLFVIFLFLGSMSFNSTAQFHA